MWHRIWSCHGSTTCSDMKANCEGEEVYPWITSIQWSRQPHSSPHSLPHTNLVLLPSSQNLPTLPIPLSTIAYLMIPSITLSPASSTCWIISVRIPTSENSFPFPIPSFLASEKSNIKGVNGLVSHFVTNCQHYRQRFQLYYLCYGIGMVSGDCVRTVHAVHVWRMS